jgi:hypothetical protein
LSSGGFAEITRCFALTVDGDTLDVADVILLGVLNGDWPAFERQVEFGLALEHAQPEAATTDEVRREATAFRYAHRLISAADFRRWLEDRGMSVQDLSGALRRRLLRGRIGTAGYVANDYADPSAVLSAEVYCDGILTRLTDLALARLVAGQLAGAAPRRTDGTDRLDQVLAVAQAVRAPGIAELGDEELHRRLSRLILLESALTALRDAVADPEAVARRIKDHGLDWLELRGDELRFAAEGAAREARLLITVDGESPEAVAERAKVAVASRSLLIEAAPQELGSSLAAKVTGEVVGPWQEDGHWHVLRLRDKVAPSAQDDALRERAIDELLTERIDRYAAGRVTRNAQL